MNINKAIVRFMLIFAFFITASTARSQEQVVRKELGVAELGTVEINRVDAREITLKPLQKTGLHLHPGGVVGYIVTGEIGFQIEGQEMKILKAGDSFYEPPNAKIIHFDNNSKKKNGEICRLLSA